MSGLSGAPSDGVSPFGGCPVMVGGIEVAIAEPRGDVGLFQQEPASAVET